MVRKTALWDSAAQGKAGESKHQRGDRSAGLH